MKIRQAVVAWGLTVAFAGGMGQAQTLKVPAGTAIHVRLVADLVSAQALEGARVDMEVAQPVMIQGAVAIPQGAVVWGAVQVVKKGKVLRFDIEGVRLPDMKLAKLRCSPQKSSSAAKEEIKVETQVGGDLGAAKGSEFTAYLDEDLTVNAAATPAPQPSPTPAAPSAPAATVAAPVAKPLPEVVAAHPPKPEAPPVTPAPVAVPPAPAAPAPAAPAAPMPHAAPAAQPGEYITVECFSDPTAADIYIDDEYHGNTPSILKLQPGKRQIEYRLMGYKAHAQSLDLTPGTGLRTVRMTLEKMP